MAPRARAYGYLTVRATTSLADTRTARDAITRAATREGYALAEVFVEQDPNRPGTRLAAMIEATRRTGIRTVILSDPTDLGNNPTAANDTRRRLQREAHLTVLIAGCAPERDLGIHPRSNVKR